jgi:hypothetical protein
MVQHKELETRKRPAKETSTSTISGFSPILGVPAGRFCLESRHYTNCSIITTTGSVSEILARRGFSQARLQNPNAVATAKQSPQPFVQLRRVRSFRLWIA